jgi:aldehyde dehydrogenase (NAD+)
MTSSELRSILTIGADGRTRDLRYRQRQFISLHNWITRNTEEIEVAAQKDDKLSKQEAQWLVASLLTDLRSKYDSLDLKKEVTAEYSVKYSQDYPARRVPHEIGYVIPEKYTLFLSAVYVLCSCLTAGSCCLVEVSIHSSFYVLPVW